MSNPRRKLIPKPEPKLQPESSAITADPATLVAYYDNDRKEFLMENDRGRWQALTEAQFKRNLRKAGFSTKTDGNLVSPAEIEIDRIMNKNDVDYAGGLAGKTAGFCEDGIRMLVTTSPQIPTPRLGEWLTLQSVINGLLPGEQADRFSLWIKIAFESLKDGRFQPGQCLAIAGPTDSGKSLLQNLITEMLGGRAAKAARYMMGRTDFNADLCEVEHLMLEDEFMSSRMPDRQALGANIKSVVVNRSHSLHRKGRTAVTVKPWWRMSITLNDEPDNLMVLPPLDDHVADKVMLLRASRFDLPMPTGTAEEKERFWEQLVSEVPAFLDHLKKAEIPEAWRCRRYGVTTWHHPELARDLAELSQEAHLLTLIDSIWPLDLTQPTWTGSALELKSILINDATTGREAKDLLSKWSNATGVYLGRIARQHPDRVKRAPGDGKNREWIIHPLTDLQTKTQTMKKTG